MRWIAPVLSMMFPSLAMAQTAPSVAPAPLAASVPEKKICRSETETGSIFARRVCRTKAEWAAIAAVDERNTQNFQHRRMNNLPTSIQ